MDNVSCDLDVDLSDLIDYKDCIFIVSDNSRAEQLKKDNDEFSYVSPTGWLGFINTLTISRILRDNSIEPFEAVYITGDSQEEYNDLGISTILIMNDETPLNKNNLSDHCVKDIPSLIKGLKGKNYGYFGELWAHGVGGKGGYYLNTLSHELIPSVVTDLVVFGRYFVSNDSRAYIHPFSQLILQMKNGYAKQMKSISELFASSINHLYKLGLDVDTITVVPPKLNKKNVLLEVINNSKNLGDESLNNGIEVAELLFLKENYKPQKEVGNHTNRFVNVKDKFKTKKSVDGHILLVDDIITSGATALECAKVLYEAGADKVTVLAFGASQSKSGAQSLDHIPCKSCEDGEYKMRFGKTAFYGCNKWPNCDSTLNYEDGRRQYNASRKLQSDPFGSEDEDLF
ncbi:hypothetical protein [Paenibacillus sp. FSL P2-0136]|uniref:ComF family protein n=1 Tax=Paenibacillus sp. FSL P2-0136 TaxID=2975317 RepID=UPI0030D8DAD8